MNAGCLVLACSFLVGASVESKPSQPIKPPCTPGFSQNFYTVIVSRDLLHGQRILKGRRLMGTLQPVSRESVCLKGLKVSVWKVAEVSRLAPRVLIGGDGVEDR
ncbi:hypothetical protein D4764_04G0004580 [Takifugu flavidus]|uniref:Uncharacterized protein n=1 Tax=Takifugu flavidus TaxID=433684 RepID=A0A5C6N698_9TELE|nr:hypothetical protein D4764_04G0004580 [Takifugu flavidus]